MILKDPELRQIDADFLCSLKEKDPEALADLSLKLATDLKEARERLNQTSSNSSRPSGSFPLWDKVGSSDDDLSDDEAFPKAASGLATDQEADATGAEASASTDKSTPDRDSVDEPPEKRKPGRQTGSQGFGRTQLLPVTHMEHHWPDHCQVCNRDLNACTGIAYTGFYTVDTLFGELESPGLELTNTHHLYYCTTCPHCDLDNRAYPARAESDEAWDQVGLTEWRLVGPGLASLIVYLAFELRVSRRKVQRFFDDVFGLKLSVGTLQNVVVESARALAPVEEQLVEDLLNESLIHADETSHNEAGALLWLWVFISRSTALFFIGHRTLEIIDNLLDTHPLPFKGYLMSDGYPVYRHFKNRLRCWAHLIRKAKALGGSYSSESRQYGQQILLLLYEMIKGVHAAREGPDAGKVDISPLYESQLVQLRAICERMLDSDHKKTRELGVEFINDWTAIFRILQCPEWPLTNNEAERALRHWVILRKITQGTRSAQGSRALALIASVMETCRLRNASPLRYIRDVIEKRRQGLEAPKLPPVSLNEALAVGR